MILLAAAGSETVTKLVGNGVMTFAEHPDERRRLQADPSLAGSAVEEVLRWKAPSQYQGRFSLADRAFHGGTIPAGSPGADRHRRGQPGPAGLRRARPVRHRPAPPARSGSRSVTASTTASAPTWPASRARSPSPRSTVAGPTSRSTSTASSTSTWPTWPDPHRSRSPSRRRPMQLKPGCRLESATCDTQVVVVRAPKDGGDVDLRCGGEPMRDARRRRRSPADLRSRATPPCWASATRTRSSASSSCAARAAPAPCRSATTPC